MYPPDGLLTLGSEYDVGLNPRIIAPDPHASDDCLNVLPSPGPTKLTTTTMGDDDPPSGLNGRLRPRKSHVPNLHTHKPSKAEGKPSPDKQRRTGTPSKASPNKHDDLVKKSDLSPTPQFLCLHCDKTFVSKQTMAKHARRIHLAVPKQGSLLACIFCNHSESNSTAIVRHMVDRHPDQYFACCDCNTRFPSMSELSEHKLNVCAKQKITYRSKLRQKIAQKIKKKKKTQKVKDSHNKCEDLPEEHGFNGIVISCELKPSQEHNAEDIEDNITTNLILPPSKGLGSSAALEKSAVVILDDLQWNKRIPPNFTFHNTDADQILSRLGVVHKSPRTGESTKKDLSKSIDEISLKFERCFDTTFYSKVSSNVQENLSRFLDGSFNFNPDPESIIKTRKSKKSVVINTAEGFPILLACEQYSRSLYDGYMPRSLAPRHKWIRDNLEIDRALTNPDQIKRDSHVNNCIVTLVSGLDIWTQLCMRRKFEDKNRIQVPEKKTDKRTNIRKELEDILESRELPSTSQVEKPKEKSSQLGQSPDFPASLGLVPSTPSYDVHPAVLSGEWVRPRCYVCCACGAQTRDPRTLTSHIATRHPNAQVQHYEIVGEVLLNADILKHLYVPPSQMSNRTRPLRGFRDCTKCVKSISLEDLHQHMLDCAGDTPAVRRRQGRPRPFNVRRRRPRLADNTVRKKIRKDIRTRQRRQKNLMRPRPKIRTEVGDAETIRKMLADLPAKRHRVLVNPLNNMTRPRIKRENQKKKVMMKKRSSEDKNIKDASGSKDNNNPENNNSRNIATNSKTNDDKKSLRSRISRATTKSPRQSQSVKSNSNINKIKRKSVRLKEQKLGNKDADISQDLHTELSNDDSLKKIDVKEAGYKAREHANRSGSNNRSEQRQGCSRSNNNSNNAVAPTQSVPLKHSIARLTANSETHDKSVQFHHLFLVQQECNNVNQHMPSGQQTLFENEAAIVRFDKPPLNFGQRASLDSQKNKMNKPRKGLNDCIAMLKHKLLDPVPSEATGHVSVQCGSDEPIDFDIPSAKQTTPDGEIYDTFSENESNEHLTELRGNGKNLNTNTKVDEILDENKSVENTTAGKMNNEMESLKQTPKLICDKEHITQIHEDTSHNAVPAVSSEMDLATKNSISSYTTSCTSIPGPSSELDLAFKNTISNNINLVSRTIEATSNRLNEEKQQTIYSEFESVRINIMSDNEHSNKQASTNVTHVDSIPTQKDIQVRTKLDLARKLPLEIFPQPKDFKDVPANVTQVVKIPTQKDVRVRAELDLARKSPLEIFPQPKDFEDVPANVTQVVTIPTQKDVRVRAELDLARKSPLEIFPQPKDFEDVPANVTQVVTIPTQKDVRVRAELDLARKSPLEIFPQPKDFEDVPANVTQVVTIPTQKDVRVRAELDLARKSPLEIFPQPKDFEDISAVIPPAHASTNVAPMLPVPLDLSSKTVSSDSQIAGYKSSYCVESYDCYETLDLSNKSSFDIKSVNNDDVVDLRVKPVHPDSRDTLNLCIKSYVDERNHFRGHCDNRPTDLTVKGKAVDVTSDSSQYEEMLPVKDLSSHTTSQESRYHPYVVPFTVTENCPTNLSGKITGHATDLSGKITGHGNNKRTVEFDKINLNDSLSVSTTIVSPQTNLLSSKSTVTLKDDHISNHNIPLTKNQKLDSICNQNSMYDSALVVPQYKMNTTMKQAKAPVKNVLSDPVNEYSCSSYNVPNITTSSLSGSVTKTPVNMNMRPSDSFGDTSSWSIIGKSVTAPAGSLSSIKITSSSQTIQNNAPIYTSTSASISVLTDTISCEIAGTSCENTRGATVVSSSTRYTTSADVTTNDKAYVQHKLETYSKNTCADEVENIVTKNDKKMKRETQRESRISISSDQDPDTARKIAMLPKELVEIIGNMPADHRNQLLNVLPQYVSTSISCANRNETNKVTSLEPLATGTSQTESLQSKELQLNMSGPTLQENLPCKESLTSHQKVSDHIPQLESCHMHKEISMSPIDKNDEEPLFKLGTNSKDEGTLERDHHIADPYMPLVQKNINTLSEYNKGLEKIIDLTYDESSKPSTDMAKVVKDIITTEKQSTQGTSTFTSVENPVKIKLPSEKTASLRAVRIKAPAERKKENQLQKRISVEQQHKPNVSDSDDNEVNKSLETNASLAIQQAEISSTQSNKNVQLNITNDPETNVEETHRLLPSPKEKIIGIKNSKSHDIITKSSNVTSSIPANETTRDGITEVNVIKSISTNDIAKGATGDKIKGSKNLSSGEDQCAIKTKLGSAEKSIEYKKESSHDLLTLSIETEKENDINIYPKNKTDVTESLSALNEEDSEDDVSLAFIVKQKQKLSHEISAPSIDKDLKINDLNRDHEVRSLQINKKIVKRNKRTRKLQKSGRNSKALVEAANATTERSKKKGKKRVSKKEHVAVEKSDINHDNDKEKLSNSELDVIKTSEQDEKVMVKDQDLSLKSIVDTEDKSDTMEKSSKITNSKLDVIKTSKDKKVMPKVQKLHEKRDNSKTRSDIVKETAVSKMDPQKYGISDNGSSKIQITKPADACPREIQTDKLSVDIPSLNLKDSVSNLSKLNRSRRGKSLNTENHTSSEMLNDTVDDYKTPLTKKQLIFSKLLDEETIAKQTDDNENKNTSDITATYANDDTVASNLKENISSSDTTSNTSNDKTKGTKRKKPLKPKGKCKKKKSLEKTVDSTKNIDLTSQSTIDAVQEPNVKEQNSITETNNIQEKNNVHKKYLEMEDKNNTGGSNSDSVRKKEQLTNTIKKRKGDLKSFDDGHKAKFKKTKEVPVQEHKKDGEGIDSNAECNADTTLEIKITSETMSSAAVRRTRSKSVIVKSTSDLYDPYDIDFDDISETAEPFRKTLKQMKAVNKLSEVKQMPERDFKITEKVLSAENEPFIGEVEKPKRSLGKLKTKPKFKVTTSDKKVNDENICHSSAKNSESKAETDIAQYNNENFSDSDDSSKSDVPLKKYLEEKEKRMAGKESNKTVDTETKKKETNSKTDVGVNESEEQLRSEQFMESFGFFSERKPRKSNLLAAKKISETFHIIANENDDLYGDSSKQRMSKKPSQNENKKSSVPNTLQLKSTNKSRKGRKPKRESESEGQCYCYVCKKTFQRPDNYVRHQMTLLHISKVSEVEMKVPTNALIEEPNYLVAFRDQINSLKTIALTLATDKNKKNKIKLPSLDIILEKVNEVIMKQKLRLSTDQELFLDCCELLKESHIPDVTTQESITMGDNNLCCLHPSLSGIDMFKKINIDGNADTKSECDSITAKSILESEEVRNLENDLICGLKEAAKINRRNSKNVHRKHDDLPESSNESVSSPNTEEPPMQVDQFDLDETELNKYEKHVQTKAKMYPDVEDIDLFEDKFDKIKRKCRSQAAAAKQTQSIIEANSGHKTRKKIEKKKGKKYLKKNCQSAVLTKGALKGFDGIKVSIPTSEINIPGIGMSLPESSSKKKKRKLPKKNREQNGSESSTKYDSDSRIQEGSSLQRKHDVYEFMDNEDAELFEFRPSTLMERFKSMNTKEYNSKDATKLNTPEGDVGNTSESGSDGDDFVYMSDDYVCSEDETENSLLSCEMSNLKAEARKNITPPKRRDVVEKNAVMGKIFKHNAVRTEKKATKAKDTEKPKTNLDQLFDSLLEDDPVSSTIINEDTSPCASESEDLQGKSLGSLHSIDVSKDITTPSSSKTLVKPYLPQWNCPSTSKRDFAELSEPSTSKSFTISSNQPQISSSLRVSNDHTDAKDELIDEKSANKNDEDDTGVARQRARRKCTVGKQNVLAETWSSESEPDGVPIRSNSAESLVASAGRKKKGKKREGTQLSSRRGSKPNSNKRHDAQSRENCSQKTNSATDFAAENLVEDVAVEKEQEDKGHDRVDAPSSECEPAPPAPPAPQGPPAAKGQPRSAASYWSPGGAAESDHVQQHGWIVGDSHKKLVTMLAHAKGRKRHNDDERNLDE